MNNPPALVPPTRQRLVRNRNYMTLLFARSVSIFGNSQAPIALSFAVLSLENAGVAELGVVLLCKELTQIALFAFGGTASDRLPSKVVLISSDIGAGLCQAFAAVAVFSGFATVWMLAIAAAANGAAFAFFYPAATSALPQTVAKSQLHGANSAIRLSMQTMTVAGAACGGVVVSILSPAAGLALDAVTFGASALILVTLRLSPIAREGGDTFVGELKQGWVEFRSRRWLWSIVLQYAVVGMVATGVLSVIGPVVAETELSGPSSWALFLAAEGTGLMAGTLINLRYRPNRSLLVVVLAGPLLAVPPLAFALEVSPMLIGASGFLAGGGYSLASVNWSTTMQRRIEPHLLGRLSSYDALGSWALIPLGLAASGPVAAATSPGLVLSVASALIVTASLPLLTLPEVRAPEPAGAACE